MASDPMQLALLKLGDHSMKTKELFFTIASLLFLAHAICLGETILGRASIRDTLDGTEQFVLYNSTNVDILGYHKGWLRIALIGYVDTADVYMSANTPPGWVTVKRHIEIRDKFNNIIGVTSDTIHTFCYEPKADSAGALEIILKGYVRRSSIRQSSIIEKSLEVLLKRGDLKLSNFVNHLGAFQYSKWDVVGQSYIYYQSVFLDPSPGPRIILFFEKDELFAILFSESIDQKYFTKIVGLAGGYKAGFPRAVSKKRIRSFEKEINYIINNSD